MNKYDLNEGNDALKRILLMMKYDNKKTLSENTQIIEEQMGPGGAATAAAAGGAATGAGLAAASLLPGTAALTGAGGAAFTIGTALGAGSATAALALGGAVLGGAAALAIVPLAYWYINKDIGSKKVKTLFEMCSTDSAKIAKLPRKIDDNSIRDMSDTLYDAMEGLGTDEDEIFNVFRTLTDGTASDACALVNRFKKDNPEGLFEWLDDDIDDESEWRKIYIPLRNCIEDSLLTIKDETKTDPSLTGSTETKKWKDCRGTYTQGCMSDVIRQVQGCLGIVTDAKFGPKTQKALESKGFKTGFTDKDITTICQTSQIKSEPSKLKSSKQEFPKPESEINVDNNTEI